MRGEPDLRSPGSSADARRHASRVLEMVAEDRGHALERMDADLLLIRGGGRVAAFYGWLGPSTGRPATELCGSRSLLHRRLAAAGLPVPPQELHPCAAGERGWQRRTARTGALLVAPAAVGAGPGRVVDASDREAFDAAWTAAARSLPRRGVRHLVVMAEPGGRMEEVAVVGSQAVGALVSSGAPDARWSPPAELDRRPQDLAIRAVAAITGLHAGWVTLATTSAGDTWVRAVSAEPPPELFASRAAVTVADHILIGEGFAPSPAPRVGGRWSLSRPRGPRRQPGGS